MFQKLIDELKKLEKEKPSVTIKMDEEGYYDRECPNCKYQFKIEGNDWKDKIAKKSVYCPLCRHEADSNNWFTTEQAQNIHEQAKKHIYGITGKALEQGAKEFNSKQNKNSFIRMSIEYKNTHPYHFFVPIVAKEEMQLKVKCKECETRYAVIGSAFFCPNCGHNSADETFDQSIKKIKDKLKNLSVIRKAIEEISKDEAETTCCSLIEASLNESVVAFQRFCEKKFSDKYPYIQIKFNAFQNLQIGGEYWTNNYGKTYCDWLTTNEFNKLNVLFQRRHLLSHTEGIVDQKYIEKSADSDYIVGQRIVVKEDDVNEMINLITKITNEIRKI